MTSIEEREREAFTYSAQEGVNGHCLSAQVWDANGNSVAIVDGANAQEATERAKFIAEALTARSTQASVVGGDRIFVPVRCQNGHKAVASFKWHADKMEFIFASVPRSEQCHCPKHDLGQGYYTDGEPYMTILPAVTPLQGRSVASVESVETCGQAISDDELRRMSAEPHSIVTPKEVPTGEVLGEDVRALVEAAKDALSRMSNENLNIAKNPYSTQQLFPDGALRTALAPFIAKEKAV